MTQSNKNPAPKTGLAGILRDWMKSRTGTKTQRRFTITQLCDALCVPTGATREKVIKALDDFHARGEVVTYFNQKHKRRQYLYIQDWKAVLRGHINRKIYKAMYVSGDFAVTDVQRLTGIADRDWMDKIVRKLVQAGHLTVIRRRRCAHGAGAENIYHVVNRDKFKLEVMR